MKQGDLVKVLSPIPNSGSWRTGTILTINPRREVAAGGYVDEHYLVGVGEKTHFNYKEEWFSSPNIKRFQPQTNESHVANLERDLPIGLELAKEAISALLPDETVLLKVSDQCISGYHGSVTIDPVQFDQETIGAFIERTGYQVTVWKYHHATRSQPEEYVDAPVGTFPTIGGAVQEFIKTVFKLKASDYWDHKADQAQAAEWEVNNAGGEAYIGGM